MAHCHGNVLLSPPPHLPHAAAPQASAAPLLAPSSSSAPLAASAPQPHNTTITLITTVRDPSSCNWFTQGCMQCICTCIVHQAPAVFEHHLNTVDGTIRPFCGQSPVTSETHRPAPVSFVHERLLHPASDTQLQLN